MKAYLLGISLIRLHYIKKKKKRIIVLPLLLLSTLEKTETMEFARMPWRRLLGSVDYAISLKH